MYTLTSSLRPLDATQYVWCGLMKTIFPVQFCTLVIIYHYFLSITASRSEAITVMQYNRFDNINNLFYASYTEHVCPKSELVKIYDDEVMVNIMFNTALHFQQLGISVTEMLLTLSVIITMPGKYITIYLISSSGTKHSRNIN